MVKFCIFAPTPQREELGGFLVANFLSYFPKENGLKSVTPKTSENFTTFSTAKKEIYHLELALGATSRKNSRRFFGRICIRIEFEFCDQEHFSRMCIRICYKVNSCEKREVRASNSKSMVLRIFHVCVCAMNS